MKPYLDVFKGLTQKLSDFLEVIDISFFLSGAVCFGALALWGYLTAPDLFDEVRPAFNLVVIVVTCYVLGLLCYPVGRLLRHSIGKFCRWLLRHSIGKFCRWLLRHSIGKSCRWLLLHSIRKSCGCSGLWVARETVLRRAVGEDDRLWDKPPFNNFKDLKPTASQAPSESGQTKERHDMALRLYRLLWAELRESEDLAESQTFIQRRWVNAAIYDSLSAAILVWLVFLLHARVSWWGPPFARSNPLCIWGLVGLLVVLMVLCWWRARKAFEMQVGELVATIAFQRARHPSSPAQPPEQGPPSAWQGTANITIRHAKTSAPGTSSTPTSKCLPAEIAADVEIAKKKEQPPPEQTQPSAEKAPGAEKRENEGGREAAKQ